MNYEYKTCETLIEALTAMLDGKRVERLDCFNEWEVAVSVVAKHAPDLYRVCTPVPEPPKQGEWQGWIDSYGSLRLDKENRFDWWRPVTLIEKPAEPSDGKGVFGMMGMADPVLPSAGVGAVEGGGSVETSWRNAALRIGEDLADVGPIGYYKMSADQWLTWAIGIMEAKHDPQPPATPQAGRTENLASAKADWEGHDPSCIGGNKGPCNCKAAAALQGEKAREPREWWINDPNDQGHTLVDRWEKHPRNYREPYIDPVVLVREVLPPQPEPTQES